MSLSARALTAVLLAGIPSAALLGVTAAPVVAVRAGAEKLLATRALPLAESVWPASRLTDRKFRRRAGRRRLSADAWQRGPNQRTMDRAVLFSSLFVFGCIAIGAFASIRRGCFLRDEHRRLRWSRVFNDRIDLDRLFVCLGFQRVGTVLVFVRHALGTGGRLRQQRCRRVGLAPLPRHFCVLVFVFSVAGRAASLLDVGPNHRDNSVIGDAALPGTVVVQNVTKP